MRMLTAALVPLLLTALATALPSGPAHAGKKYYKWQDEQGVWHYEESKPKDREAEQITVTQRTPGNDVASEPVPMNTPATASTEPAPTNIAESDEEAEAKVLANRQAGCDKARQAVSMYENYARVTVDTDGDGKQEPLNTAQQIERMKEARAAVKEYCD